VEVMMEFRIDKKNFLRGLLMVQTIIERRSTIPILSNTLIQADGDAITLAATDLETAMKGRFPASVVVPGQVSLPARKLFEIVRELPEAEIHLVKKENNWVTLTCEKSVFNLAGINPEEFPPLPELQEQDFHPFPLRELRQMIERTVFSASTEESRYNLNGVFFKALDIDNQPAVRMVATDGHRLSLVDKTGLGFSKLEAGVIISKKGLLEIKRLIGEDGQKEGDGEEMVHLSLTDNNFVARKEGMIVLTRLIEGEFPDYESVIPTENDKKISLSRDRFIACLKRISTLATEKGEGLMFEVKKGSMVVSSSSQDLGDAREDLDVDYSGEDLAIGFNGRYLLDALSVIDTDMVTFELKDNATAVIVRPVGQEGYLCLVMPMKL
jgi:DNA polymerase-3 subunit beta